MLPDTGERYLSTQLFDGIGEEMTSEEIELSQSTPHYRFDVSAPAPAPAPAAAAPQKVAPDAEAMALVADVVAGEPVVMFALEWCEFCWSVRKLFAQLGVPYRSIDLDSVQYQKDNLGMRIRPVLAERCGAPTIPQIFIGGEHMGGCTDLFAAFDDGSLKRRLQALGIEIDTSQVADPRALLPKWLHPRQSS